MRFDEVIYDEGLLKGLSDCGFENLTEIQEMTIPKILDGDDLIACAQTGTGKTGAFILPIIDLILEERFHYKDAPKGVRAVVVAPTRELAKQIDDQIMVFTYHTDISSISIYGGSEGDWGAQRTALEDGCDIVVATPGRFISHLNLDYANLKHCKFFVLDEADKMLDMGFVDDINKINSALPKEKQTLLFSATMPPKIRTLAKDILVNPQYVAQAVSVPAEGIEQMAYMVHDAQKVDLLKTLIDNMEIESLLIFASRKTSVDQIARRLKSAGYKVAAIHSDRGQRERESMLQDFMNKTIPIVVATDILSRGIDVDNLSHVINFDCPKDPEDYVHRIGRTARNKATGVAITFINETDIFSFNRIEKLIQREVPKKENPKGISEGPKYTVRTKKGKGKGGPKKSFSNKSKPAPPPKENPVRRTKKLVLKKKPKE